MAQSDPFNLLLNFTSTVTTGLCSTLFKASVLCPTRESCPSWGELPTGQHFYHNTGHTRWLSTTIPVGWLPALHSLMNFGLFLVGAWSMNICSASFPLPPEFLFEIATAPPLHHLSICTWVYIRHTILRLLISLFLITLATGFTHQQSRSNTGCKYTTQGSTPALVILISVSPGCISFEE